VKEVWNKDYAKQLFEEARLHPEVAELIENIKSKVSERVDIDQLLELWDTVKYVSGRSALSSERIALESPMRRAIEYVTTVLPDGNLVVPAEMIRQLDLKTISKIRVVVLHEEE
jgi:hypothetical protein